MFDHIYISDYIWKLEINKETQEYKAVKKLMNKGFILILDYNKLTPIQREFYLHTYNILKNRAPADYVNEGERVTAAFAKAHGIPYYMSDDNKAAPFIKSLSVVEVINYCDLLYMAYVIDPTEIKRLSGFYSEYLSVFPEHLPRAVKDKSGKVLDFISIIQRFLDAYGRDRIDKDRLRICGLLAAME